MIIINKIVRKVFFVILNIVYVFFTYLFVFKNIDYHVVVKVIVILGFFSVLKRIHDSFFVRNSNMNKVLLFLKSIPSFLYAISFLYVLVFGHFL